LHPEAVIDGALSSAAPFMQAGGGEETVVGDPEGALPIDAPLIGGARERVARLLSARCSAAAFGRSLL
jgi:hypothetical protein